MFKNIFIMILVIIYNDNDYQYQSVAVYTTKKCVGASLFYVYVWLKIKFMSEEKISTLLSDVSIEGDLVEKDKLIIDAKINGDIKSEDIVTHPNSNITGNINSKNAAIGGKVKGNIDADRISIQKTADIDGVLNQKILSVQEGATLKIKTQTNK